ncbi:MAG: YcxB family protein [Clostridia bacterium]|nr:YcxB family protein [Clostridia bacterium]
MEKLYFSNTCIQDTKNLVSIAKGTRPATDLPVAIVALAVAIFCGIKGILWLAAIGLVAFIYFMVKHFYLPFKAVNRVVRESTANGKANAVVKTLFYDDKIRIKNLGTGTQADVAYDKIIGAKTSDEIYIFMLEQKMIIAVDKADFKKDEVEAFKEFIKGKVKEEVTLKLK